MKWRQILRSNTTGKLRDLLLMTSGVALLMVAALVLSAPSSPSSSATPFASTYQGQPDYSGYPSPLNCAQNTSLCYPYTRVGTLSVFNQGSTVGQTTNVDLNNTQTTIGTPVTAQIGVPLTVQWDCQPYQTASLTCQGSWYTCNCSWWGGCAPCQNPPYECGVGTIYYSSLTNGTGFSTGNALTGSVTVNYPSPATSYTLTLQCINPTTSSPGGVARYYATVTVAGPSTAHSATLTANPASIQSGSASTLSWVATEPVNQCSITP